MLWWLHAALLTSGKHVGSDGGSQHWPAVTSHLQITERAVREAGTDEQVVISRNGVPVYTFERNRAAGLPHHGQWSSTFLGSPAMISQEAALIKSYLFKDATMLEWGSGGSTLAFSPLVSRYYAIEDNENWARLVDKQLKERRIAGASVSWVKPDAARGRMTGPAAYKTYCAHAAVAAAKMGVKTFDFVLIDGRGRQFCAKQVTAR